MSEPKGLTLRDAILSGKRFKRPGWDYWVEDSAATDNGFWDRVSLTADDYILEQSDADKIRDLQNKIIEVLEYCKPALGYTWAEQVCLTFMDDHNGRVLPKHVEDYIERFGVSK